MNMSTVYDTYIVINVTIAIVLGLMLLSGLFANIYFNYKKKTNDILAAMNLSVIAHLKGIKKQSLGRNLYGVVINLVLIVPCITSLVGMILIMLAYKFSNKDLVSVHLKDAINEISNQK